MLYHIAELTVEEVNLIGHALAKLPYEAVHGLVTKLKGQVADHDLAEKHAAIVPPSVPAVMPAEATVPAGATLKT